MSPSTEEENLEPSFLRRVDLNEHLHHNFTGERLHHPSQSINDVIDRFEKLNLKLRVRWSEVVFFCQAFAFRAYDKALKTLF